MSGPEDNPADEQEMTKEEYEAWERKNAEQDFEDGERERIDGA